MAPSKRKPFRANRRLAGKYVPSGAFGASSGWAGFAGSTYDGKPIFNLMVDVPRMLNDPTVQFALWMLVSPLGKAEWTVKCKNEKAGKFVDTTLRKFWSTLMPQVASDYFTWGWSAMLPAFSIRKGFVRLEGGRLVWPADATPHVYVAGEQVGQFAGMEVNGLKDDDGDGNNIIETPHAFWFGGYERRGGRLYDNSRLKWAFDDWCMKNTRGGVKESQKQFLYKFAVPSSIVYYPTGYEDPTDVNSPKNKDRAYDIAGALSSGSTIIMPDDRFPDDKGEPKWRIEVLDTPSGQGANFIETLEHLDRMILKGMGIPPEVIEASESGSGYSGRAIPQDAFFGSMDGTIALLIRAVNHCLIRQMVDQNFGPGVRYEIEPTPLAETVAAMNNPQAQQQGGNPLAAAMGGGDPTGGGPDSGQLSSPPDAGGGKPPAAAPDQSGGDPTAGGLVPYLGKRGGRGKKDPVTGRVYYNLSHDGRKYGCLLATIHGPLRDAVMAFGKTIPADNLADDGCEDDPHLTLRYGLHSHDHAAVFGAVEGCGSLSYRPGELRCFEGPDHDVLYVSCDNGECPSRYYDSLSHLPNTATKDGYVPHVTVAYLKKGKGKEYVGKRVCDCESEVPEIQYHGPDGRVSSTAVWPSAEELERMLAGPVEMGWDRVDTTRGKYGFKAVGNGEHTGRTLYGPDAEAALGRQNGGASPASAPPASPQGPKNPPKAHGSAPKTPAGPKPGSPAAPKAEKKAAQPKAPPVAPKPTVQPLDNDGGPDVESSPLRVRPAGFKMPWQMSPDELKSSGMKFFRTDKGSIYASHPETGSTIRVKANLTRLGHDSKDRGLKDPSVKTFYVDPKHAIGLTVAGVMAPDGTPIRARTVIHDGKATLLTWNQQQKKWGYQPGGTSIPVSTTPKPGMAPYELWRPKADVPGLEGYETYATHHVGHPITSEELSAEDAHREFATAARNAGRTDVYDPSSPPTIPQKPTPSVQPVERPAQPDKAKPAPVVKPNPVPAPKPKPVPLTPTQQTQQRIDAGTPVFASKPKPTAPPPQKQQSVDMKSLVGRLNADVKRVDGSPMRTDANHDSPFNGRNQLSATATAANALTPDEERAIGDNTQFADGTDDVFRDNIGKMLPKGVVSGMASAHGTIDIARHLRYKAIANEMGYDVGPIKLNADKATYTAQLTPKSTTAKPAAVPVAQPIPKVHPPVATPAKPNLPPPPPPRDPVPEASLDYLRPIPVAAKADPSAVTTKFTTPAQQAAKPQLAKPKPASVAPPAKPQQKAVIQTGQVSDTDARSMGIKDGADYDKYLLEGKDDDTRDVEKHRRWAADKVDSMADRIREITKTPLTKQHMDQIRRAAQDAMAHALKSGNPVVSLPVKIGGKTVHITIRRKPKAANLSHGSFDAGEWEMTVGFAPANMAWTQFLGPRGGHGWEDEHGNVRYQAEMPTERLAGPEQPQGQPATQSAPQPAHAQPPVTPEADAGEDETEGELDHAERFIDAYTDGETSEDRFDLLKQAVEDGSFDAVWDGLDADQVTAVAEDTAAVLTNTDDSHKADLGFIRRLNELSHSEHYSFGDLALQTVRAMPDGHDSKGFDPTKNNYGVIDISQCPNEDLARELMRVIGPAWESEDGNTFLVRTSDTAMGSTEGDGDPLPLVDEDDHGNQLAGIYDGLKTAPLVAEHAAPRSAKNFGRVSGGENVQIEDDWDSDAVDTYKPISKGYYLLRRGTHNPDVANGDEPMYEFVHRKSVGQLVGLPPQYWAKHSSGLTHDDNDSDAAEAVTKKKEKVGDTDDLTAKLRAKAAYGGSKSEHASAVARATVIGERAKRVEAVGGTLDMVSDIMSTVPHEDDTNDDYHDAIAHVKDLIESMKDDDDVPDYSAVDDIHDAHPDSFNEVSYESRQEHADDMMGNVDRSAEERERIMGQHEEYADAAAEYLKRMRRKLKGTRRAIDEAIQSATERRHSVIAERLKRAKVLVERSLRRLEND